MEERGDNRSNEPLAFRFLVWLGPPVLCALLRALYATCRFAYQAVGLYPASRSSRGPLIYVAWHRDILMLSYPYRNRGIATVISQSRDGEMAARTVRRMGYCAVRGSSSRGGISALKELTMLLRNGHSVGILADGPRGPAGQTKAGVIYLAYKTGASLIPLAAKASRSITFRSWDRMVLPLPFSGISIMEGEPLILPSDLNRKDLMKYCRQLTQRINELHRAMAEKNPSQRFTPIQ